MEKIKKSHKTKSKISGKICDLRSSLELTSILEEKVKNLMKDGGITAGVLG